MLYMLVSILLLGRYLNNKRLLVFSISFIFFYLAAFSRYTMLIQGLIFLFPLILLIKQKKLKGLIKIILVMLGISVIFVSIFCIYNYLRFHNPFEVGMRFQKGVERYDKALKQNKIFSINYIPHNFDIYFLHHLLLSIKKPYLNPDKEGNSVFSVYPVFLLLFIPLIKKIHKVKHLKEFYIIAGSAVILGTTLLLMNLGTGWVQFGLRYLSDITPAAMLLLIPVFAYYPSWLTIPPVLNGLTIQLYGVIVFVNTLR